MSNIDCICAMFHNEKHMIAVNTSLLVDCILHFTCKYICRDQVLMHQSSVFPCAICAWYFYIASPVEWLYITSPVEWLYITSPVEWLYITSPVEWLYITSPVEWLYITSPVEWLYITSPVEWLYITSPVEWLTPCGCSLLIRWAQVWRYAHKLYGWVNKKLGEISSYTIVARPT